MIERLDSISIENFRSIGGRISIPLNAPVVLIHGPNGVGKTSVLSAIELALTGRVDAMQRTDEDYKQHLVHVGASTASIAINVQLAGDDLGQKRELVSEVLNWTGEPVLSGTEADFFSDRCYLAQSTLGRLLEIYSRSDGHDTSALARFASDVLKLDILDNLEVGLQPARDIRNARRLVPGIADLEQHVRNLDLDIVRLTEEHRTVLKSVSELEGLISEHLSALGQLGVGSWHEAAETAARAPQRVEDEPRYLRVTEWLAQVRTLSLRLSRSTSSADTARIGELELALERAEDELNDWSKRQGRAIDALLGEARERYRDLPSIAETGPGSALRGGLDRIDPDWQRIAGRIGEDEEAQARSRSLSVELQRERARVSSIDDQIASYTQGAAELARILAELASHIHSTACPVCGRDFSEISKEPLSAEVARRASQMSNQADKIASLSQARATSEAQIERLVAESKATETRRLDPDQRMQLIRDSAQIESWARNFRSFEAAAAEGDELIARASTVRRAYANARQGSATWLELGDAVSALAAEAGFSPPEASPLTTLLDSMEATFTKEISALEKTIKHRREVSTLLARLNDLQTQGSRLSAEISTRTKEMETLRSALSEVSERRDRAKALQAAASAVHQTIIETVFNENLNSVWRDLFIRLAPNEPFVPQFRVSAGANSRTPQLVTVHRSGTYAGSPGAMLSAGNLNTAALTLFLALHLSAGERMPILMLDDPVQSMDDVHISQLAALLRTLSKQSGRQVIIAVHERALFDYLTLELSPAFEGDQLGVRKELVTTDR